MVLSYDAVSLTLFKVVFVGSSAEASPYQSATYAVIFEKTGYKVYNRKRSTAVTATAPAGRLMIRDSWL